MSNSSFDINLVYQSLRETKSRINLNCAVGRIASLALAMTREKGMGRIASLALAMTREAYKSLRETKPRINLNCAVGRHN